jgi:hypothetical protein
VSILQEELDAWSIYASHVLQQAIERNAPVGETGTLSQSFEARVAATPDGITITITSSDEKYPYVVHGTGSHPIGTPGQFLYSAVNGFSSVAPVEHPGTQPNRFVDRALDEAYPILAESLQTVLHDATRAELALPSHL